MRFNEIIDKLGIYIRNHPNIHKDTLKEVVNIFWNGLSKQEREVFKLRCSNKNFDLFNMLELESTQKTLKTWFKYIKNQMRVKI
jgi:hypothetical protein